MLVSEIAGSKPGNDHSLYILARGLGAACTHAGILLATAESCTGGWIAKCITDVPGSSAWFRAGIVVYANEVKIPLLGVPAPLLKHHGAVSREVAEAMAQGVRTTTGADLAVAVTGVAGPGGGTAEKPVGTVWLAWADAQGRLSSGLETFPGNREQVRRATVRRALKGLLDAL